MTTQALVATRRWLASTTQGRDLRERVRRLDGDRCVHCGIAVDFDDRRGPDAGVYDVVNYSGLPHRLRSVFVSCRRCNTDRRPIGRSRLVALRARRVRRWLVGGAR